VARYILLAVDDNKDAAALVKEIRNWKGVYIPDLSEGSTEDKLVPVVVRAVFAKPDLFCECVGGERTFTRGTKLGWWVHAKCGKPSKLWAEGDSWWTALGTNLLPISEDAPEWRGFNHMKHPGYNPDNPQQRALAARKA